MDETDDHKPPNPKNSFTVKVQNGAAPGKKYVRPLRPHEMQPENEGTKMIETLTLRAYDRSIKDLLLTCFFGNFCSSGIENCNHNKLSAKYMFR